MWASNVCGAVVGALSASSNREALDAAILSGSAGGEVGIRLVDADPGHLMCLYLIMVAYGKQVHTLEVEQNHARSCVDIGKFLDCLLRCTALRTLRYACGDGLRAALIVGANV